MVGERSVARYEREREIYEMELYPNLAKCVAKAFFTVRKVNYAVMVINDMPKNTAVSDIGTSLSSLQLLKLTKTVLELIK